MMRSQACTDVPIYCSGEAPVNGYSVSVPQCYTDIEQKKQREMNEVGHHSIKMAVPQGSDKMLENKFWSLLHLFPCMSIIQVLSLRSFVFTMRYTICSLFSGTS